MSARLARFNPASHTMGTDETSPSELSTTKNTKPAIRKKWKPECNSGRARRAGGRSCHVPSGIKLPTPFQHSRSIRTTSTDFLIKAGNTAPYQKSHSNGCGNSPQPEPLFRFNTHHGSYFCLSPFFFGVIYVYSLLALTLSICAGKQVCPATGNCFMKILKKNRLPHGISEIMKFEICEYDAADDPMSLLQPEWLECEYFSY